MGYAILSGEGGAVSQLEVVRVDAYSSIPVTGENGKLYLVSTVAIPNDRNGILWTGDLPSLRADGTAIQNGDVCILGGMKSQVPVQVLPGYYVYPRAAYQRIGGIWTQKTAWIRYGGNLVQLAYYLYKNGTVSGVGAWAAYASANVASPMTLSCSSTINGAVACPLAIDFTDLHTVRVLNRMFTEYYGTPATLAISRGFGDLNQVYYTAVAAGSLYGGGGYAWTSLDVSGIEGIGYVGAYAVYGPSQGSQITEVLFE